MRRHITSLPPVSGDVITTPPFSDVREVSEVAIYHSSRLSPAAAAAAAARGSDGSLGDNDGSSLGGGGGANNNPFFRNASLALGGGVP